MNMNEVIDFFKEYPFIATIALTSLSILTAIIIFKKTGNRTTVADQKNAIIPLIIDIQNSPLNIEFGDWEPHAVGGGGGSGIMHKLTLFEIGDLLNEDPLYSNYDPEPVYFAKGSNQIIDLKKHINNPSIPIKITNTLAEFYNKEFDKVYYNEIESRIDYVKIETGNFKENTFNREAEDADFKIGDGVAFKSYLSFKTCCQNLEKSIIQWKNKNNVELQIRKDKNSF